MEINFLNPDFDGRLLNIGIIRSRFNERISLISLDAALKELIKIGVKKSNITIVSVPGALEIGIALIKMAKLKTFDSFVCLGAVIRGDTYHFEVVSNEMSALISRISIDFQIPIANGILTTDNEIQAFNRAIEKGESCARVAVEMANLQKNLTNEFGK